MSKVRRGKCLWLIQWKGAKRSQGLEGMIECRKPQRTGDRLGVSASGREILIFFSFSYDIKSGDEGYQVMIRDIEQGSTDVHSQTGITEDNFQGISSLLCERKIVEY